MYTAGSILMSNDSETKVMIFDILFMLVTLSYRLVYKLLKIVTLRSQTWNDTETFTKEAP